MGVIGHAVAGEGGVASDHTYNQLEITDTQPGASPTWVDWKYNEKRTLQMEKEVYDKLIVDFGLTPKYSWVDIAGDDDAKIGLEGYGNCDSCWTNGIAPTFKKAVGLQGVLQKFNAFDERTDSYKPISGKHEGEYLSGKKAKVEILNDFLRGEGLPPIPNYSKPDETNDNEAGIDIATKNRPRLLSGLDPIDGVLLPR